MSCLSRFLPHNEKNIKTKVSVKMLTENENDNLFHFLFITAFDFLFKMIIKNFLLMKVKIHFYIVSSLPHYIILLFPSF